MVMNKRGSEKFEFVAPPRNLAKTVLEPYLTDTLGIFQSYTSYI